MNPSEEDRKKLQEESWKTIEKQIILWRRALHQIPELENELPETASYVKGVLTALKIPHETLLGGSAVVGLITGTKEGTAAEKERCIALRADMDALEVTEETGLDFASTNGRMHACGHDAHTAMLLGAAAWLSQNRERFCGQVKLLFQPGEERPGGAKPMIEEGCLQNPKVDVVFGMHNGRISNELRKGEVGWRNGPIMAAVDVLQITVKGKGGHGGYPENAVDPIPIACELILALQLLISRERHPGDPAVLSITSIHAGSSMNIIPDKVVIEGTCRNSSEETRRWLASRIQEVADGIAHAHHAQIDIDHQFVYGAVINNKDFMEKVRTSAAKVVGEERMREIKFPVMAGEDFSYFAQQVPGVYIFLSNMLPIDGQIWPHHNSRFALDESYFLDGAKIHAQVALDYLNGSAK